MAKRGAAKVKKEPGQLPKRGRADDDVNQNVAVQPGEQIELDGNSPTSDQQQGNMREQDIPGPSRAVTTHRQKLLTNVENYLSGCFNEIETLTGNLGKDRQSKTELSAKKEILDKMLEDVTKRIDNNEKKLKTAKKRVKSFEDNYKNEEPAGKIGEYECLGSATGQ